MGQCYLDDVVRLAARDSKLSPSKTPAISFVTLIDEGRPHNYDNLLASLIGTGKALPKDARGLEIHPGVWGGIGLIRQGTGTTIVGDPESVVATLREYEAAGAEVFILGNYPHVEEAYRFADLVFPLLKSEKRQGRVGWY